MKKNKRRRKCSSCSVSLEDHEEEQRKQRRRKCFSCSVSTEDREEEQKKKKMLFMFCFVARFPDPATLPDQSSGSSRFRVLVPDREKKGFFLCSNLRDSDQRA
jgi:hypothetical protein